MEENINIRQTVFFSFLEKPILYIYIYIYIYIYTYIYKSPINISHLTMVLIKMRPFINVIGFKLTWISL